jgi:hypothetical protein
VTLNLFKSSDPFSFRAIAQDFAIKQKVMLEGERKLYRENMKLFQKELKEKCDKDLEEVSKSMNDIYTAKEKELITLKLEHRQLSISHTVLESNHALLTIKSAAQSRTEGYTQLQKEVKELEAKLKVKEDESELYEKQCIRLTEAFVRHGMNPPAEVLVDAPALAPSDDCGWGTADQQTNVVHNNGWGIIPAHAPSSSPVPIWTDPIPDPLTPTIRTDGTITKALAKDPGKANEITAPISIENVVEISC